MSAGLAKSRSEAPSPLQGFAFTEAWLQGSTDARASLPVPETLLLDRLRALDGPGPAKWQPWNETELEELRDFNIQAGNRGGARLVELLSHPDALVVVTGQQPNLLVSPLYILYKALSAIAWAKKLSTQLNRAVTPVFWVASDDDDFTELSQAWMVSHSGELLDAGRHISRGEKAGPGSPAYDWNLSESLQRLSRDLEQALGGWPGGEQVSAWLNQRLAETPDFEMNFCRLLATLLGENFPMIFVAPRLKAMRRRGAAILLQDMQHHASINRAVSADADHFNAAGYPVTLAREPEALNFFWLNGERRCRLIRNDATNVISAVDPANHKVVRTFSDADLRLELSSAPERFAPNVITRPAVQDSALPTTMYIAGPGELAYLAVLGKAYVELGVVRSAVAPRALVRLEIPGASTGTSAEAVLQQGSEAGRKLLDQISDLSAAVAFAMQDMRKDAEAATAAAVKAVDKTESHFLRGISQLKKRLARQVTAETWQHHSRINELSAPGGKTQERMLSPWNFVKPGEWDALARHLESSADFSEPGPHNIELPPWMEGNV